MTKEGYILMQGIVGVVRQGIARCDGRPKFVFGKDGFVVFVVGFRLPFGKGDIDIVGGSIVVFLFFPFHTANDDKVLDETTARVGLFVNLRQLRLFLLGNRRGSCFLNHGVWCSIYPSTSSCFVVVLGWFVGKPPPLLVRFKNGGELVNKGTKVKVASSRVARRGARAISIPQQFENFDTYRDVSNGKLP